MPDTHECFRHALLQICPYVHWCQFVRPWLLLPPQSPDPTASAPSTNASYPHPGQRCHSLTPLFCQPFQRYTPQKNKQRLQLKKQRRKAMKTPGSKLSRDRDRAAALASEGDNIKENAETKRDSRTETAGRVQ